MMHCSLNELSVKISSCFLQQAHLIISCLCFAVRLYFFCSSSSLTHQALFFQGTRLGISSLFFLTCNSHLPFPQHYLTSSHDLPGFCWDKPSLRRLGDFLNWGRQVLTTVHFTMFFSFLGDSLDWWLATSAAHLHHPVRSCAPEHTFKD